MGEAGVSGGEHPLLPGCQVLAAEAFATEAIGTVRDAVEDDPMHLREDPLSTWTAGLRVLIVEVMASIGNTPGGNVSCVVKICGFRLIR